MLALFCVLVSAALVTGRITAVVTSGVSMNPVYYQGDLVVVAHRDHYVIGDIVAYRAKGVDALVLHRIIAGDGAGGFTMKGDNNSSIDPFRPTTGDIAGTSVLHVSGGGHVLHFMTDPVVLGCAALLMLLLGESARRRRRSARTRRRQAVDTRTRTPQAGSFAARPRPVQTAWVITGLLLVLGLGLGVLAWTAPSLRPGPPVGIARSVDISYTADVPPSPAYDGTVVTSPDPVYRKLSDTAVVEIGYTGPPGDLSVGVALSATNGWHSDLPPLVTQAVTGDGETVTAPLDLRDVQARADAAAEAIGIPTGTLTLTLTPSVTSPGVPALTAPVPFEVTPLVFVPATGRIPTVADVVPGAPTTITHTLGVGAVRIPVVVVRWIALLLLVAGIAGAVFSRTLLRREPPLSPADLIRRQHGAVLAEVRPMPTPTDRHIVDVTDFATMAKLARRVGLLVMHWTRSGVHTYLLIDDTTAYRYRHGGQDDGATNDAAGDTDADVERVDDPPPVVR
ncbi:hypothetical protein GCM10009818_21960 [Nakamurella flavida]